MVKDRRSLYSILVIIAAVISITAAIIVWFMPNDKDSTRTTLAEVINASGASNSAADMHSLKTSTSKLIQAS